MTGGFYEGSDLKLMLNISGMGFDQSEDTYTVTLYTGSKKLDFPSSKVKESDDGNYYLTVPKEDLEPGSLMLVVTARVKDEDFPGGYRTEVSRPIRLKPVLKI